MQITTEWIVWIILVGVCSILLILLQHIILKKNKKIGWIMPLICFLVAINHIISRGVGTGNLLPKPIYFIGINYMTIITGIMWLVKGRFKDYGSYQEK